MENVVIVGASLAGVHAAEGLRERGYVGSITMIDGVSGSVADRPPLSKAALSGAVQFDDCTLRPDTWALDLKVTYRTGRSVVALDTAAGTVTLEDGHELSFDGLVIATGLRPRPAPWLPPQTPGVHVLRNRADSETLREHLLSASSVAVVGGGFLGLEVAATARSMGLTVTVLEYERSVLARVLPDSVGEWFTNVHERHGVEVRTGVAVSSISQTRTGFNVQLSNEDAIYADVVVAALGADPVTEWLSGSSVDFEDGVLCKPDLSTSVPGIVAAGDVARWPHPVTGKSVRLEHWTNAVEQGRHAAGTLLGESYPFSAVPYFWTDQFDARARFVGWVSPHHEAYVKSTGPDSLVVAFGDRGEMQGAVCVNAPKELALMRRLIDQGTLWSEIVDSGEANGDLSASHVGRV